MRSSLPPRRPRRRGVALISALMVMVIIVIISSAFVTMTASDVRSTQTTGDAMLTLYLAEAGVEWALWIDKHNISVYPRTAYDTGVTTIDESGGSDARGSVVTLVKPVGATASMEHVLLNDVSLDDASTAAWPTKDRYCGTFEVSQTVVNHPDGSAKKRITITSTGRLRQLPTNWNWTTNYLDKDDLTTTAFANIRSQRTINVTLDVDPNPTSATATKMFEIQWYEKFR